ncbi:DNA methyltransferase [Sphingomonas sp. MM-1]|uniref:DNA methyltransferase n=1 Tax=Sphingomonas sp. MM-1 TaxID=745310 RepID=UPI000AABDD5F|nr:DNA methyltransferase [Sphingomonas sp. MM-1]
MKLATKSPEDEILTSPVAKRRGRPRKNPVPKIIAETEGDRDSEELPATVDPRNSLNDLTAREWIPETVSVWNQRGLGAGHPDAQIERQHPAPFSFTDVGRLIRFFTKKGHIVLDPFVGVGSTLKACAIDERRGIGIELNPDFAELSRQRLATEVRDMFSTVDGQRILEGDARDHLPTIADESVDFVVTSPPYWSILKKEDHKVRQERIEKGLAKDYGTDARDLANIENYDDFLRELAAIFGECARVLKRGRYMAIIVSDFRDKSKYIMFHADLARALETYGLEMRGLKVLYQRHKKVFPYGYPYAYVPNIHNQYILILQKPKSK